MPVSAKVIQDSISAQGIRLTSFEIICHRWILAEINTHRMLSRNYRSSRAVPTSKLLEEIVAYPAMPVEWRKNKPGMVAGELMSPEEASDAERAWRDDAEEVVRRTIRRMESGLHKQWTNRPLETYLFVHGVISGTEWANFFHLRRAPDAQPEFKALADAMWEALSSSVPTWLGPDEWHLPYITPDDWVEVGEGASSVQDGPILAKVSAARVARVSVKPHDGTAVDIKKDLALADKLLKDRHMSPFEHAARPDTGALYETLDDGDKWRWDRPDLHGNFKGWCQYRKMIPGEYVPG